MAGIARAAAAGGTAAVSAGGTSITGLLGVAFVILKLTGVISWSWLWVLAPFWAPFLFAALIACIFAAIFIIALVQDRRADQRIAPLPRRRTEVRR